MAEFAAPYSFIVIIKEGSPAIPVDIEAASDDEAYVRALILIRLMGYKMLRGALGRNHPGSGNLAHMMFYEPKRGWYYGDERDNVVLG